ncbi:MAG: hypothetical protein ACLTYW_10795 [Collinsella sp.]
MDIDNFEWWYSEGEAPDEEWDEPAPVTCRATRTRPATMPLSSLMPRT